MRASVIIRNVSTPESPSPEVQAVLEALKAVKDPDLHVDIVTLGFVKNLEVSGDTCSFSIELTTPACPVKDELQNQAEEVVRALGYTNVNVEMTARVREAQEAKDLIPGVKHCIAVASGKGGVGKSTVAVNLAVALAQTGARVGLLDADVYGPSIPQMVGCENEHPFTRDNRILPILRFGVKMMSLGFLLQEGQAVLWRGPMVAATVKQLLEDVAWDELDYLLVDLPPGTGDAPMSLAQLVPLTGVVLVTTPEQVAANIASKSVMLFRRLNTPLIGVIENMSSFVCPSCGTMTKIFAGTSGEDVAKEFGVPFLGSIPLNPKMSACSERGTPIMVDDPASAEAKALADVAGELARSVSIASFGS